MNLAGSRVLITGGGSGIGRATAELCTARGARVAICGRTQQRVESAAREIGALGIRCDVSREDDVRALVARATEQLGGLDVLVNNAGRGGFGALVETSADEFRQTWETNTLGAFLVGRECARVFAGQGRGSIVNVGSTAARRGFAGGTAYCASKFALTGMTECWRAELRKSNVRVMQVDPSEVQNDFGEHSGRGARKRISPRKLVSSDVASLIVALLELEERGFAPGVELWAVNPDG